MVNAETQEYPVLWVQGATCTGCSVSVLNSVSPSVKNVLVDEVIPGKHVNLRYQATIMAAAGDDAIAALEEAAHDHKGAFLLVVEGAIPTRGGEGRYGSLGERDGHKVPFAARVEGLARDALAVIALGNCAAYGGVAAANPNPSESVGVGEFLADKVADVPVVNLAGCPPHPDWFVGTIASVLLNGLPSAEDLDEFGRPKSFYGKLVHENCQRRAYYDEQKFAKKMGDEGCLYELGCKGPVTHADCPTRLWNGGVNWCIGAGSPCIGCASPGFPDAVSPLYEKTDPGCLTAIGAE